MIGIKNVLVVGGGIGGLTAATALRRKGIAVDLIEKNPGHSVYGVGIIQPNNTLRALDRIGLANICVERGGPYAGYQLRNHAGESILYAAVPNTAAPNFPPINGITRPVLQDILLQSARKAGANIRIGVTVSAWSDDGSGISVTFSDGTSARYDLMVGADGIYSQIRKELFPDAPVPIYSGQSVWRYNFKRPAELRDGELWYGQKTKVGLIPLAPDLMYIFVVTEESGNPFMPVLGLAAKLRERLAEYGGLIARLREQVLNDEDVVYKPLEHLMLPKPWYSGRVVLIGDAAHATTPHLSQGAAMAIEDAVLLADVLAENASPPEALVQFMRRRFDRAKYVVDVSTQLADWELANWAGTPDPRENASGLMAEATLKLMEAY